MNLELFCVLLTVAISVAPFIPGLRNAKVILALALLLTVVVAWAGYERNIENSPTLDSPSDRPIEVADRGFVSSKSCRQCHPGEYASWHASYHRTMTQYASPESVVGNFDDVELEFGGQTYRLSQSDDRYWVSIGSSTTPAESTRHEIVMTTGSHHMQFYWYSLGVDREIGQLPFVFLFSEDRWVPSDSTFLRPPHNPLSKEHGIWNQNCLNCHSTGPQPRLQYAKDSGQLLSTDTQVAEMGIACEACHGPAEDHVALNQNAVRRYEGLTGLRDENQIVHPDSVTAESRSQLCGQCHGISFPKDMASMRNVLWDGFDYRAGDDFLSTSSDRILVQNDLRHPMVAESLRRDPAYLRSYFWADGMVRVSGREFNGLVRSPCYQHEDETQRLQCMSCHQLHPTGETDLEEWADDQLRAGMRGNDACVQCHEQFADVDEVAAHTHHDAGSGGSLCYNCHMPHTTYGLLKGIRSHTVSTPSVAESAFLGRPNACNLCHLDKTLAWTAEHLQSWYKTDSPSLPQEQKNLATGVLWATQADAGTRGLVAWHLGWPEAKKASGEAWQPPLLGLLMTDSYDAVRYVAYHSLLEDGHFKDFEFDYTEKPVATTIESVLERWQQNRASEQRGSHLLIDDKGRFDRATMLRLLERRDNRDVVLNE